MGRRARSTSCSSGPRVSQSVPLNPIAGVRCLCCRACPDSTAQHPHQHHDTGSLGIGPGKSTLIERFLVGKWSTPLSPTAAASVRVRAPYVLNKGYVVRRRTDRTATPKGLPDPTHQITRTRSRAGKLSVQFTELPSDRHALAAAVPAHLPTADALLFVYDTADRKCVPCPCGLAWS